METITKEEYNKYMKFANWLMKPSGILNKDDGYELVNYHLGLALKNNKKDERYLTSLVKRSISRIKRSEFGRCINPADIENNKLVYYSDTKDFFEYQEIYGETDLSWDYRLYVDWLNSKLLEGLKILYDKKYISERYVRIFLYYINNIPTCEIRKRLNCHYSIVSSAVKRTGYLLRIVLGLDEDIKELPPRRNFTI